jgi:hypothetical protein
MSRYEMACGAELDSSQLPANIPCAQPIIKLLKLIWYVLELLTVAYVHAIIVFLQAPFPAILIPTHACERDAHDCFRYP